MPDTASITDAKPNWQAQVRAAALAVGVTLP
jgi:hypothetical protein